MTINIPEQKYSEKNQNNEVILSVKGVSKKFCRSLKRSLFYGIQDIASELVGMREKCETLRNEEFWALKDVSFQLRRGEALGFVGKNGSGKTTLLRIIAGLIKPDTGCVQGKGRIAPLIALGAGFNPILTGRENIYTNMSILGLSKKEIDQRFDAVVDFAEIGDAIDAPVKTYSSGMAARLGFASAIHTQPDILLLDEVLAVGDIKFKTKCYGKLHELRQKGTSFVMVSHSSHSMTSICDSAIYLQNGKKVLSGNPILVMNKYENDLFVNQVNRNLGFMQKPPRTDSESTGFDILAIFFRDKEDKNIASPTSGEMTCLVIKALTRKHLCQVSISLKIREISGESGYLIYMNSCNDNIYFDILPGKYEIQIQMPSFVLGVGIYDIKIEVNMQKTLLLEQIESFEFAVKKNPLQGSSSKFYQPHLWKIVSN
jgi:lipopolysaccharide transport system ATP-binding protein